MSTTTAKETEIYSKDIVSVEGNSFFFVSLNQNKPFKGTKRYKQIKKKLDEL